MASSSVSDASVHPMISFDGVEKVFPSKNGPVTAVQNVSLDIAPGEFTCFVGPSGCGKTTMLRMVAGLIKPSTGQVSVDAAPVRGPQPKIGIVFQKSVLLPWRTALDNVLLPIEVRRRVTDQDRETARGLLAQVGLAGFEQHYPTQLSGGMQQRVSISRALIQDPDILLMDEPFGAIDALTREQMNRDLNQLWNQTAKTVMLITHSIPEAVYLGKRVVVMGTRPGRVIETIDIPLPDDRPLSILGSPEFGELTTHVRELLNTQDKALV